MAKKKKKDSRPADYWTNPYYREQEEKANKLDPNRPMFFTYLLMPIGTAAGVEEGLMADNLFCGAAFGFVLGILAGTKLDAKFPRKKK